MFIYVQEAPWKVSPEPPATWPDNGKVEFNSYQVRYREGLDLVLKGITFSVEGGEKVTKSELLILILSVVQ